MRNALVVFTLLILAGTFSFAGHAKDIPFFFHLTFDDGKGDMAEDESGNGNDGKLVNVDWSKDGKFGGAIEFAGVNGYVEVEKDVPEEDFTMALWIKTDNPGVGVYSVLDGAAGAGGHDRHFYLQSGKICFRVWQGNGWCTDANVADGDWHHIALVTETGAGQTAYVDGEQVGTFAYDHSDFNWQKRVWIGFSNDAAIDYFEGLIDEPMYISAPLTEDEIPSIMEHGFAVEAAGKLSATWGDIKVAY